REDLLSSNDHICHPAFTEAPKLFLHPYQMAWLAPIKNSSGGHLSSPLSTSPSVGSTTMEGRRSFSLQ
ncbi:UNVERIFIED_CONTAM: hypothetical protein K2H54_055097, partial [Gekko kuhli]